MSDLPHRLAQGDHRVAFQERRGDPLAELKAAVDREYVHVRFTETRGGTELGFPLDQERSDLSGADWKKGEGRIHVEGELNLDGVQVRCVADIDLTTFDGEGRLEILEEDVTDG